MKHLKLFEELNEEPDEIAQYLKDIFLELEDINFDVKIIDSYKIQIKKAGSNIIGRGTGYAEYYGEYFPYKDIKETIASARDYMKSMGYKLSKIQLNDESDSDTNTKWKAPVSLDELYEARIYFTKI